MKTLLKTLRTFVCFMMISSTLQAADRYWVGGTDSLWNNTANWSTTSGGSGGASVPGANDTTYFDANSSRNCYLNVATTLQYIHLQSGFTRSLFQQGNSITVNRKGLRVDAGTFEGGSGAITINAGGITLNGGTLNATSGTLTLVGSFTNTSGTFNHNNGTIILWNANTISGNALSVHHLQVRFGNYNINTAVTVNGTFTYISFGNDIAVLNSSGSGKLHIKGNIALNNNRNGGGGSTVMEINGSGNQTINSTVSMFFCALPHIKIEKASGTLKFKGEVAIGGTWDYVSGTLETDSATLNFYSNIIKGNAHSISNLRLGFNSINVQTALSINKRLTYHNGSNPVGISVSNGGTVAVQGDVLLQNGRNGGSGNATLLFNGTGNQNIISTIPRFVCELPNVKIEKPSGVLKLKGEVSFTGTWDYVSGTLETDSATLNFYSNIIKGNAHSISNLRLGFNSVNVQTALTITKQLIYHHNNNNPVGISVSNGGTVAVQGDVLLQNNRGGGSGNATLLFNGTGNQNITSTVGMFLNELPHVKIEKPSGILKLKGEVTVAGTWDYVSGTLETDSATINFMSNNIIKGTAHTLANIRIRMNYLDVQTALNISKNLIYHNHGSNPNGISVSNGGSVAVQGNIYLQNTRHGFPGNATLTLNGTGTQLISSTVGIGASSLPIIVINKPSGILQLQGTINLNNSWTHTQGTIDANTFNSTVVLSNQNNTINGKAVFDNLRIQSSDNLGITFNDTITVKDTLLLSGTNINILNGKMIQAEGHIINSNTAYNGGGTATIELTGSNNQTLAGLDSATVNAEGRGRLPRLTINKTAGTLTWRGVINIHGKLTWQQGFSQANTYSKVVLFETDSLLGNTAAASLTPTTGNMAFYELKYMTNNTRKLQAPLAINRRLILSGSLLKLNSQVLNINTKDSTAIEATARLLADDTTSKVIWQIGNSTRTYTVPFVNSSLQAVSLQADITQAGVGNNGSLTFNTYRSNSQNLPYPESNENSFGFIDSNLLKIADRYWLLQQANFDSLPTLTVRTQYAAQDLASPNTINEDSLNSSVFSLPCWTKKTGTLNKAQKHYTATNIKQARVALALHDKSAVLVCNDGKTCANAYLLTAADYNNTVFNMTDTVMWFRFVAIDTFLDIYSIRNSVNDEFNLNGIFIHDSSCIELTNTLTENNGWFLKSTNDKYHKHKSYLIKLTQAENNKSNYKLTLSESNQGVESKTLTIRALSSGAIPNIQIIGTDTTFSFTDGEIQTFFDNNPIKKIYQTYPAVNNINHALADSIRNVYTIEFYMSEYKMKKLIEEELITKYDRVYYVEKYLPTASIYTPNEYYDAYEQESWINWRLENVDAREAWGITKGCSDVKIAIIEANYTRLEDGILKQNAFDIYHEDLKDKILNPSVSLYKPQNMGTHGTMVAGSAAATTDNGLGIASIGFNSSLLLYLGASTNNWIKAVNDGAKIISLSYGSIVLNNFSSNMQNALDLIREMGTLVFAGAGNGSGWELNSGFTQGTPCRSNVPNSVVGSGNCYISPASYANVISVSSVNSGDQLENNWCCQEVCSIPQMHTQNDRVDILAPGFCLYGLYPYNSYEIWGTGTSFATPFSAGLAALLFCINPCLTPDEVESTIINSGDDIRNISNNNAIMTFAGHNARRINAYNAVLAAQTFNLPSTYDITTNTVWNSSTIRKVSGITVRSGKTLTITNQQIVKMSPDAKIIVERGAKLEIDNATIIGCASGMWQGIELWGNDALAQPLHSSVDNGSYPSNANHHGVVILKNNAQISDAVNAIYAGKRNNAGSFITGFGGGIVRAFNSIIINNQIGVFFAPYLQNRSVSLFSNCKFETTRLLNNISLNPVAFVTIALHPGAAFIRNTFENTNSSAVTTKRGVGIWSYLSNPRVGSAFSTLPGRFNVPNNKNTFKNLFYGVRIHGNFSLSTNGGRASVLNNTFTECTHAIYAQAVKYAEIKRNTIELAPAYQLNNNSRPSYGIYLDGCTGVETQENTIKESSSFSVWNRGIYTTNSSGNGTKEEIYNNDIDNLAISLNTSLNNKSMQFVCNNMTDGQYHLYSFSGQIEAIQGGCFQNAGLKPAGNTFTTCNTNLSGDPHLDARNATGYIYWYNGLVQLEEPNDNCVTTSKINKLECINIANTCSSKINYFISNPPINPGVITGSNGNGGITVVNNNIDGVKMGLLPSYNSLKTMLNSYSLTALQMKDSLMAQGNKLTDDILISSLAKKSPTGNTAFFSAAHIRDILVNNAPHTQEVITAAKERQWSLIDYLPQILAAQDSPATARLDSVLLISSLQHAKGIIYNSFIQFALEDSNDISVAQVIDSLKLEDDLASTLALIEMYIAADSIPQAQSKLNNLTAYNKELRSYKQLKNIELQLIEEGYTWLDTAQYNINTIWTLTADDTKASREAQAILSMVADTVFIELIEDIEDSIQFRLAQFEDEATLTINEDEAILADVLTIKVYPNPAKHEINIELSTAAKGIVINMYDLLGSKVLETSMNDNETKYTISTQNIANGLYLYDIRGEQEFKQNGRLVIIK